MTLVVNDHSPDATRSRVQRSKPIDRTYVITGAASGIGAATARYCRERGGRVIACDLHDADVIADLTTAKGRAALVDGVSRLSKGRIDAIVANAGGGPPETSLSLNFFGAVATLEGLRPLLQASSAPRAVAVSSVAALQSPISTLVEACLNKDEAAAVSAARDAMVARRNPFGADAPPPDAQAALNLYGTAKYALQLWCRRAAPKPEWAGAGIVLNVISFGVFDTPGAAPILSDPNWSAAMGRLVPLRGDYPARP
ncbi:MAG: SDR family NAD(P)-dependent oxidoreductase, partial [Verrucomicrobia bacterium]|nr:SDR family NAD(P)-dependent oxidoreductase [Verrucomicrobiota bacterium]